jgi:hypothetical protein
VAAGKPVWTTSSFLVYSGGLTVLFAAIGALSYLSGQFGAAAYSGWALLIFVLLAAKAEAFRRIDRWLASGIFAFASVIAWGAFIAALFTWFGWLDSSFSSFCFSRLLLELLVLVAAVNQTRRYEFPFIAAIAVFVGWFFVIDLLSSGGNWTAWVTLFVGLMYFVAGSVSDSPSSFWLHFAAGLLIGGSLLYWWHSGTFEWILIGLVSLIYIGIAHGSKRSSWAVFGTLGLFAMTSHFSDKWSHNHVQLSPSPSSVSAFSGWVPPLVFAILGGVLVALGLGYSRRRSGSSSAH